MRSAKSAIHEQEREQMRAGWRLVVAILGAGLALGPAAAPAQSTDAAPSGQPADTVGPRELQNFSLSGTVTKPADETAPASSTPTASAPAPEVAPMRSQPVRRSEPASRLAARAAATQAVAAHRRATSPATALVAVPAAEPSSVEGVANNQKSASESPPTITTTPRAMPASSPLPITSERALPVWPWLLAALVLAAGMALLFWRNRQRHAFAGGPDFDFYVAPEPAPAPPVPTPTAAPRPELAPAPIPAPAPPVPAREPPIGGIVSSRLRPLVELAIEPLRCIVGDHQIVVEFELELFNSGNAPARDILVEAAIFNPGPMQDQEIGAFISQPVGAGERLETILPLQRVNLRTQVTAPHDSVQIFDAGERQVFVPLIAFNALYHWNNHEGQTSVSYLLGRITKGEKLAPFRVDLGPRVFRGLAARPLPLGLRR